MEEKYKGIAHSLDMSYVEKARQFVKSHIINKTFKKEIKIKNIDALIAIKDKPKLYLLYPHLDHCDTVNILDIILDYNLPYPAIFAGDNLTAKPFIGPYVKKLGCCTFKRKNTLDDINLAMDYITYLLTKEHRDVLLFPGYTEDENGHKKSGRSWDGRLQKISPFPIIAASHSYENGTDVKIVSVIINYEPYVPAEPIFQLLMNSKISTKWYDEISNKFGTNAIVDLLDYLYAVFPSKNEITRHVTFRPTSFSQLLKMFSDKDYTNLSKVEKNSVIKNIRLSLEDNAREEYKMLLTPLNLYTAAIRMSGNGRLYENDEIIRNLITLYEKLYGTVEMSKIDDILKEVKELDRIVKINDSKTTVKNLFLLRYHSNPVLDLLKSNRF